MAKALRGSHDHLGYRIAPVAGAGGADRVGFNVIDHAGCKVVKRGAGRRGLRRLHHGAGLGDGGHTPIIDGRAGNGRRTRIQFAAARAKRDRETGRCRRNADRRTRRLVNGKTTAQKSNPMAVQIYPWFYWRCAFISR